MHRTESTNRLNVFITREPPKKWTADSWNRISWYAVSSIWMRSMWFSWQHLHLELHSFVSMKAKQHCNEKVHTERWREREKSNQWKKKIERELPNAIFIAKVNSNCYLEKLNESRWVSASERKNERVSGHCRFPNYNIRMNGIVIFHFNFVQSAYSIEEHGTTTTAIIPAYATLIFADANCGQTVECNGIDILEIVVYFFLFD